MPRKSIILIGLFLLLLIPMVAVAQDDIVELIFTDGGAKVGVKDTITSVANVSVELDGKQYLMKVPVTIEIDSVVPLTSSLVTVESASRVGTLAIEIVATAEYTDEIEIIVPGLFGDREETYEPKVDGNKIAVIEFNVTNIGDEETELSFYSAQGVDDTGRLFEESDLNCELINPGETGWCVMVFDIDSDVDIVALDLEVTDHRQIPIP